MDVGNKHNVFSIPVTLLPVEITDIFTSHFRRCIHLELIYAHRSFEIKAVVLPAARACY